MYVEGCTGLFGDRLHVQPSIDGSLSTYIDTFKWIQLGISRYFQLIIITVDWYRLLACKIAKIDLIWILDDIRSGRTNQSSADF